MQCFVGAVGEKQFVGADAEVLGHLAADGLLFRIGADFGAAQSGERLANFWRAADRVLVEIETQLFGAALQRRIVGAHFRDGLADGNRRLHPRTPAFRTSLRSSTERACASRPSARANSAA